MMPQMGQAAERPPEPVELAGRARSALADLERSRPALLERSARGDASARVLLAAMVVLRDFAAKTEAAWFAAVLAAERNLGDLAAENARLRAELEAARSPSRRGRHAGERPPWLKAVRPAAPLAAVPFGLRLLGHHAAAKAVITASAVAASAVLVIGSGVTRTVPYETPAPAAHSAFRAPAAIAYSAVRIPQDAAGSSPPALTAAQPASPAPAAVPPPRASSPPPAAPTRSAPAPPVLTVPRLLGLGALTRGPLTLTAGGQAVAWTATATDGITLSQDDGVALPGQPVTLEVADPSGDGGWVYVSFGGTTVPVEVTSDLGAPALALP